MGIEPTSLAWEAKVMAIIRRPRTRHFSQDVVPYASGRFFTACKAVADSHQSPAEGDVACAGADPFAGTAIGATVRP